MEKIRIGLVGVSQLSFPGDKAGVFEKSKRQMELLSGEMDFELVTYDAQVINEEDARSAVKALEAKGIDFLLVQHTSFAAGALALVFARANARLGFWAIREGAKDGPVPFNSLCSINMHSSIVAHYLKDLRIKVKWFYGGVEEEQFRKRLLVTVRALRAIKNLKKSRVALIGGIAPGFNDLYNDERQFLRLFDGMVYNRQHEYDELKALALAIPESEAEKIAERMAARACGIHAKAKNLLMLSARFYLAYRSFIEQNGYDALAVSCWPKFQQDFAYSVCSVVAELNDEGTPIACEGDILSAISMLALKYISGDVTTLMDLSDFDENDETVLMWHCGPTASRYSGRYSLGVNYSGMPHTPGEELNVCGVVHDMVFEKMPATVFRISGECDRYLDLCGTFLGDAKPSFFGSRGWMGSLRLNGADVGARDLVNTLLVSGFQHHYPLVAGDYSDEVKELAAWLGIKPIEKVPYADHLQVID